LGLRCDTSLEEYDRSGGAAGAEGRGC